MRWGLIGYGQLGAALAPRLKGKKCLVASRSLGEVQKLPKSMVRAHSNAEVFLKSDIVILAVKPGQVTQVAQDFLRQPEAKLSKKILISAVAGVSTEQLHSQFSHNLKIIRVMPNTPVEVGEGMIVFSRPSELSKREFQAVSKAFANMGRICVLDESHFDAVTGLSGCGPAYVFLIIEALAEAGVKVGLPRSAATLLAAQTLKGAATLLMERGVHPAQLKDEVTTPKGCTVDGLMALEEGALRSTLIRAVVAASERAAKLGAA